jgi:excisionase family DNA binding protein
MTNHVNEWLTIREAAMRLGVSDLTIRRRIKSGSLSHRLDSGKYLVNLAGAAAGDSNGGSKREVASDTEPQLVKPEGRSPEESAAAVGPKLDLDSLITHHRRLAEEAGRAALLREQLEKLEQQNAVLREGIVALSNRNGWLESKLEEREQAIKLLTDSQHRRPWWKRLLGAEASA